MSVHELSCAVHVHSLHSDGTGTIDEIAEAARRAGADAVIVTDHDRVGGRAHAGWHGDVLVAIGVEVSPRHGSHLLAFGIDAPVRHTGRTMAQVLDAVHAAGGAGFAAHPFSRGGWVLGRAGRAAPFGDLRLPVDGIEVWSLVTDTLERIHTPRALLRFARDPDAVLDGPPPENLAAWDALGAERPVPAIGGLDAHQYGIRRRGRVLLRTMAYERSFALLRTHALLEAPTTGDGEADTAALFAALRAGRAFLARDSLADATGFRFGAGDGTVGMGDELPVGAGVELLARAPRPCSLALLRDGAVVASAEAVTELRFTATTPGVYRVEARLEHRGRPRVWVLGNAVYLR
jgi:hypothetical protein